MLEASLYMFSEVSSRNVDTANRTARPLTRTSCLWLEDGPRTHYFVRADIFLLLQDGPITTESLQQSRQDPNQVLRCLVKAKTLLVKLCMTAGTFLLELKIFSQTNGAKHMQTGGAGGVRHHFVADRADQNIF